MTSLSKRKLGLLMDKIGKMAAECQKKKKVCTHLVTGDLLILSGSSVTLKKKTNVYVRNQWVSCDPPELILPPLSN